MDQLTRTAAISPLRQRLIDDMNMRRFSRETQRNYIRDIGRFASFLGRSERHQVMTLPADEFIRRFLLHVLPRGFHRIRHYGLLASGGRRDNLASARELLAVPPPQSPEPDKAPEPADHRPPCPCCGGRMLILVTFERCAQPRAPPRPACSPGWSSP